MRQIYRIPKITTKKQLKIGIVSLGGNADTDIIKGIRNYLLYECDIEL